MGTELLTGGCPVVGQATALSVDLSEINHKPMPARSPATKPPDVSAHRRGPQQRGFERRDGRILSSENPDPQRVTATFERRVDGWVL
jgi:hypothetical protein